MRRKPGTMGYSTDGYMHSRGGTTHVFWLSGMSCDGCSASMMGANNPSVEDFALDRIPDLPYVSIHHPMISDESGQEFMAAYAAAARA